MSAVKERIRQFEEQSTPKSDVVLGTPTTATRRFEASPMTTTPGNSYRKRLLSSQTASLRKGKKGTTTPFMSPPRPCSVRAKSSITKAAMTDVTNVVSSSSSTPSTLPQPRRLDMTSNDKNEDKPRDETLLVRPPSVQKRREELERHNHSMRLEQQMRDVQLRKVTTTTTTVATFSVQVTTQTTVKMETSDSTLDIDNLITPTSLEGETRARRRKHHSRVTHRLKLFWELLYAALAILELLSCQGIQDIIRMDAPKAFVLTTALSPASSMSQREQPVTSTTKRTRLFGVTETQGYWGQDAYNVIRRNIQWDQIHQMTWQDFINKAFMVAIFIHALMESWTISSTRIDEKRQQEQRQAVASATKVTKRSKRRFQNLETSSTNRHFIMRWTRNKIKWRSATTEVLRACCLILLLRLVFLPIFKKNRIVTIESNSRQGTKIPFLSPIYIPKEGLEMTAEIAGRTLSYGESMLIDIISWLRSRAVAFFRRKVKEYAINFVTLALTRPWEASARVQTAFTVIRWTKFVFPLVGSCNKLRGQVADYKKKRDLKYRSERANHLWSNVTKAVVAEKRTERAVRHLQRNFRIRRQRTQSQRIIVAQEASLETAVIKLQRRFRERAASSRVRVRKAKKRLSEIGVGRQIVSYQQRELADSLRREIRERSRKNRRLLLRPNTAFSLAWKRTTIACVLIEVLYKLLAPLMASKTGEKLTLDQLIMHILTPAAERLAPLCWQQVSFLAVEFFSHRVVELVSIVSFLDVFITFSTGELDDKTGGLKPKSFFARWILPGVALQLLVNPTMKDISAVVKKVLAFSNSVGPMRVFHVALAIFPVVRAIALWIVDLAFHFVDSENRNAIGSHKKS